MKISPTEIIFVDTSALIALVMRKDEHHAAALEIMSALDEGKNSLVTTEFVLVELANALSKKNLRYKALTIIDTWASLSTFTVIWSSAELFDSTLKLYREMHDKDWSLTDCASFVVMKDRDISLAFTSDKHFEQAGFVRLLEILES